MDKILEFIPFEQLEPTWKSMETASDVSPFMYYDYMAYIVREEKRKFFHAVRIACIKEGGEILLHLLQNAVEYTPEGGKITLDYKKRGQHTHQFLVSDTGEGIPEEKRDDLFKPFLEIRDLTQGDGLGLPICKQMALRMNGDLDLDPAFTKGTRFVLELHT